MPEHVVVSCCSCSIHQAIQVNKKGKFACKLCGTSQSVKTILASGTAGRDLRNLVQELNMQLRKRDETRQEARRLASIQPPQLSTEKDANDMETAQTGRWKRFLVHSANSGALGNSPEPPADGMDLNSAFCDPLPYRRGLKRHAQGEAAQFTAATVGQARQNQRDTERREEGGGGTDEDTITAWWGRPPASPQQGNWVKFAGDSDTERQHKEMEETVSIEQGVGSQGQVAGNGDPRGEDSRDGGVGGGGGGKNSQARLFTATWVPLDDECGIQSLAQLSNADANVDKDRFSAACPVLQMQTSDLESTRGQSETNFQAVDKVALRETRPATSSGKWARFVQS